MSTVEFRFWLVLDFGVGAAAGTRHANGRREDSARWTEEGRQAAVPRPVLPLPEDLGCGPLEPEDLGREFGERKHSRRVRQ